MEETTGAPGSLAVCLPRRLRASGRDGGGVVNRPPSSFSMLLSRHTRRREFFNIIGGAAIAWPSAARAQEDRTYRVGVLNINARRSPVIMALFDELRRNGL